MTKIRVQKIMAEAGLGSRRDCETIISAGRVMINGRTAILGSKADPEEDEIKVDGKKLKGINPKIYIALNKPKEYSPITTKKIRGKL